MLAKIEYAKIKANLWLYVQPKKPQQYLSNHQSVRCCFLDHLSKMSITGSDTR